MNEISPAQRERILELLREGRSLRAIEAATGHRRETIGRYGREAGLLAPRKRRTATQRSTPSSCLRICSPLRPRIGRPSHRSDRSVQRVHRGSCVVE